MAFFRHLGKKKVKFHYQIKIQGVERLDGTKWKNGEPLYCQCKRASKTLRTTNAVLEKGCVAWNEFFSFAATMYKDDSNKFDKKPFLFSIHNEGKQSSQRFFAEVDLSQMIKEQGLHEKVLHLVLISNVPNCQPILKLSIRVWDSVVTPPDSWNTRTDADRQSISVSTSLSTSAPLATGTGGGTGSTVGSPTHRGLTRGISETQVTQTLSLTESPVLSGKEGKDGDLRGRADSSMDGSEEDTKGEKREVKISMDDEKGGLSKTSSPSHSTSISTPRAPGSPQFPISLTSVGDLSPRLSGESPGQSRGSVARSSTFPEPSGSTTKSPLNLSPTHTTHTRVISDMSGASPTHHAEEDTGSDEERNVLGPGRKKRGFSRFQIVPPGSGLNWMSGVGDDSMTGSAEPGSARKHMVGQDLDNLVANFNRPEVTRPLSGPSEYDRDPEGDRVF